jgi:hypothetical protein
VNVLLDLAGMPAEWRALGDGFAVEIEITIWSKPDVPQVPTSAHSRSGSGWALFVVASGHATTRHVEPGHRGPLQTEIVNGVTRDEVVIIHPGAGVHEGARVAYRSRSSCANAWGPRRRICSRQRSGAEAARSVRARRLLLALGMKAIVLSAVPMRILTWPDQREVGLHSGAVALVIGVALPVTFAVLLTPELIAVGLAPRGKATRARGLDSGRRAWRKFCAHDEHRAGREPRNAFGDGS